MVIEFAVSLCSVCLLLIVFCDIVCVVAVMSSFVRFVRVVAVLDFCECMYVGTRERSWCLEFLSCVCCVGFVAWCVG